MGLCYRFSMFPVISLLVVLTMSILITRVAAAALIHTGLSKPSARFQARSAFTGVGFTTAESERVVNHPVRRRILMLLMLLGNAGIVTAVSSLILTFIDRQDEMSNILRGAVLVGGVALLWLLASSNWLDRKLYTVISKALKRYTKLNIRDYYGLLHLGKEFAVNEMVIEEQDWMAHKRLKNCNLMEEGVLVLGITREDGTYLGAPDGDTQVLPNDTVILYGREKTIQDLDERRGGLGGELQHHESVQKHKETAAEEKMEDPAEKKQQTEKEKEQLQEEKEEAEQKQEALERRQEKAENEPQASSQAENSETKGQ